MVSHGQAVPPVPGATDIHDLMRASPRRVPVTTGLIIVNVLVFLTMLANGAGWWHSSNNGIQLAWGANFGPATKDGEWWRLGTALFLHFGVVHLVMNMWALWDGGRLVERWYGGWRFALLYGISGLVGNLLSLLSQGDRAVSGGASGAIFGVYGAMLVCLWRERNQVDPADFRWLFGAASVFSVLSLGMGFVITGIDNAAHIGGLVSGALAGAWLARPLLPASPPVGRSRWVAGAVLLLATALLVLRIPAPSYRYADELQARAAIRDFLGDDQRLVLKWQNILVAGQRSGASFDQLASSIESDVTKEYQQSFEQLSSLNLAPTAPSAATLAAIRKYAEMRGAASQSLVDGLRANDPKRIRAALDAARRAPQVMQGIDVSARPARPASVASAPSQVRSPTE
jgi:rhomboid protease GluP